MNARQLIEAGSALAARVHALSPEMCAAAQSVYDAWSQDEEGLDDDYGSGGICDAIASEIAGVLSQAGIDTMDGGQDGDDHAYTFAYDDREAVAIDIPPGVYEIGGGYQWKKRPSVHFEVDDLTIAPVDRRDVVGESASGLIRRILDRR